MTELPTPFRRGDLVWVIDIDPDRSRHRLAIVLGPDDVSDRLLVFQGDGLTLGVPWSWCIPVRLCDGPGAAVYNFAEILRPTSPVEEALGIVRHPPGHRPKPGG